MASKLATQLLHRARIRRVHARFSLTHQDKLAQPFASSLFLSQQKLNASLQISIVSRWAKKGKEIAKKLNIRKLISHYAN